MWEGDRMSWEEVMKKDVGFTGFNRPWDIDAKTELDQESLDAETEGRMDRIEVEPFAIEDAMEQILETNHRIKQIEGQIKFVEKGHAKKEIEQLTELVKNLKDAIDRERGKQE